MTDITDVHRFGMQSFLSKGVLTLQEVKDLHKFACERYEEPYSTGQLSQFIRSINRSIQPFSMEVRKGIEEDSGTQIYALVRTSESEMGRLANDYQKNELELFKKILDLIVQSESGVASSTDILNLTTTFDKNVVKITKVEAQNVLTKLIKDRWLNENQGEVSLSARAILELEGILREAYEDIISVCNMCRNIALKGQSCVHCGVKIHFHCAGRLFRGRATPTCPGCASPWEHDVPDIQIEEMNGDMEEPTPGPSGASRSQTTNRGTRAGPSRGSTNSSSRKRKY
ncbi:non-structural maintenance of chromosomes element 1 homolog [Glandiceps talaboti]